ncbi:MAG: flavodoxin domain-containing protein [Spirochaetales bacterium]
MKTTDDKPVLLVWASKNGGTETLAQRLMEVLTKQKIAVEMKNVKDVDLSALSEYRALVFGSPTYGSGDLHPAWDKPERALRDLQLPEMPFATFGCGASRYPTPHWAVDILENRLKNCGGKRLIAGLKMDTLLGLRVRDADPWAKDLAKALLALV